MAVQWELHYDRRVSEEFLSNFLAGGVARSLVEYALHAPYPLDFQLRKNPKTGAEHATLYVGLTSVLDVHRHKSGLRLEAHDSHKSGSFGFDAAWTAAMDVKVLGANWRQIEDYVEAILPYATEKHAAQEGAVQAAASVFASHERIMVDREVALHFKDTATKKAVFAEITGPFVSAVSRVSGVSGKAPTKFGGECDLLSLDAQGRLLAVEVKPRKTNTIVWAAAQATVYARLLERWVGARPMGTDRPVSILRGMLDQRARLGLAPAERIGIPERPTVTPVVAIQRGAKQEFLDKFRLVQEALLANGCGDPRLEAYEVNMAGRMDRLDLR